MLFLIKRIYLYENAIVLTLIINILFCICSNLYTWFGWPSIQNLHKLSLFHPLFSLASLHLKKKIITCDCKDNKQSPLFIHFLLPIKNILIDQLAVPQVKVKTTWKLQMSDKRQLHASFYVDFDMQNVLQKLVINIKIRELLTILRRF